MGISLKSSLQFEASSSTNKKSKQESSKSKSKKKGSKGSKGKSKRKGRKSKFGSSSALLNLVTVVLIFLFGGGSFVASPMSPFRTPASTGAHASFFKAAPIQPE